MGSIWQDVRYGLRTLRRQPGVTTVAVLTLALGIGANTAVFSVAHTLLVAPLPYPHSDRIFVVEEVLPEEGFAGNVALANFEDWRSAAVIEASAAWTATELNLTGRDSAERVPAGLVTDGFFELVGANPIAGGVFGISARESGRDTVAVLSEGAWTRLYGRRPDAIGMIATLDGVPHTIVGVVPTIAGLDEIEVWRPLLRPDPTERRNHMFRAVARLQAGVPAERATAEINATYAALETAYPESNRGWQARLTPLQQELTVGLDDTVALIAAIVVFLLLIACANVAGLQMARVADRQRELAVRTALGAPRMRLVRQVLTESVVLSLGGAVAGLFVAWLSTAALVRVIASDTQLWAEPGLSLPVLAFATAIAVATGLIFGLAPALTTRQVRPQSQLLAGRAASRRGGRTRGALAFVQLSLASVLLVASGLVLVGLWRVVSADPGFDPQNVVTFRVTPPRATHAGVEALAAYYDSMLGRLGALPGVRAAGATARLPMGRSSTMRGVIRPGDPVPERGQAPYVLYDVVSPGYLEAVGMRLRTGRSFTAADTATSQPVAIVNESLARQLWPDGNALGREVLVYSDETAPRIVVGMVADLRFRGLDRPVLPQYFVPLAQAPQRSLSIAVRVDDPAGVPLVRETAAALDPALPLYEVRMLDQMVRTSIDGRRAQTIALTLFGSIAVALAAIGLYGVIAAGVRERRREIGIRVAIGAGTGHVRAMFLRQGLLLAVPALAAGLTLSVWLAGMFETYVAGLGSLEPGLMSAVAGVLLVVALAAIWIPMRQALAVNPVETLRNE